MISILLAIIYLSFISLGLPDGLLGAAWPSMYEGLGVSVSFAGVISMIIAAGTVASALLSERLVAKLGTGKLTAISVGTTAIALAGFSFSSEVWMLCIWAVPYGLGAGSVDAALNNYVALHFKSRHMSWLHCFWGVGCMIGPYLMAFCLTHNRGWTMGYRYVFVMQIVLTAILIGSLPLWKKVTGIALPGSKTEDQPNAIQEQNKTDTRQILGLRKTVAVKGVKEVMLTFFSYCTIEQICSLWAVSYLVLEKGIAAGRAANYGALFFIGITVGRFFSGFVTTWVNDRNMVRLGQVICTVGILVMLLPLGNAGAFCGLVLIGLGCAPIYPCLIHATPSSFGADISQAVIGVQMASAYVGTCLMPPIFGLIADYVGIRTFPIFLIVTMILMALMSERMNRVCANR